VGTARSACAIEFFILGQSTGTKNLDKKMSLAQIRTLVKINDNFKFLEEKGGNLITNENFVYLKSIVKNNKVYLDQD